MLSSLSIYFTPQINLSHFIYSTSTCFFSFAFCSHNIIVFQYIQPPKINSSIDIILLLVYLLFNSKHNTGAMFTVFIQKCQKSLYNGMLCHSSRCHTLHSACHTLCYPPHPLLIPHSSAPTSTTAPHLLLTPRSSLAPHTLSCPVMRLIVVM